MKKFIPWLALLFAVFLILYPQPSQFAGNALPKMNPYLFNKEIQLHLPFTMQVVENLVEERDQLQFSAYLNDEHYVIRGYVQLWQLNGLESYLQKSKEMSTFDFYTYSLNTIEIGGLEGILNIWGASFGQFTKISGKEYWLNTPNHKVLRIAFLTNETNFSDEQLKVISYILSSLNWVDDRENAQVFTEYTQIETMRGDKK